MSIQLEHVCLVLAIVNAIVTGLVLIGTIVLVFVFIGGVQDIASHPDILEKLDTLNRNFGVDKNVIFSMAGVILAIVVLASLIAFVFSLLLCNGINNRRPGQVKAYFIYGVVTTIMAAQVTANMLYEGRDMKKGLQWLLGCVINSLFLALVYMTYKKLSRKTMSKECVHLLDSKSEIIF